MSDATVRGVEMLGAGDPFAAARVASYMPAPLGTMPPVCPMPAEMSPLAREMVWASAYGAAFAVDQRICWEAANPGPERDKEALAMVNVARCKAVADAAVERLGER